MAEHWQIDAPRVLEVGGAHEPLRELRVGLIGGRVDVLAHPAGDRDDPADAGGARIEVSRVTGRPLEVSWQGGVLSVAHPKVTWDGLLDGLKHLARREDRAEVSIAVPPGTQVRVSTISADGLVCGLRADATVRTVSGALAVDTIHGDVHARTISGRIDVQGLHGELNGESVSGSITVQAVRMPRLDVKTISGELAIDLRHSPCAIDMKSVSGDLVVRIPPASGFRLDAKTVSGQIVADSRRIGAGRPGPPQGEIRDGDESVRVSASSVSGDVTLLRSVTP